MSAPNITETARTPSSCSKIFECRCGRLCEVEVLSECGLSLISEGKGRDLVFLHGYQSSKESFYWQIKYFSAYFRVTAFDMWGFGKSPPLTEPWDTSGYAEHVVAFLRERRIEKADVIAHSFGGRVALRILSGYPDLFGRAVLTGCAGVPSKRGFSYRFKVRAYRAAKKIAPRWAEKKFGSPEYRTLSPVMRESYKKIVNEDVIPCLGRIRAPVLYVFGEKDTATPLWMGQVLRDHTRGSELVVLRGGSHFCFCEQPDAFNAVAHEFLR